MSLKEKVREKYLDWRFKTDEDITGWKIVSVRSGYGVAKLNIPSGNRIVTSLDGKSRTREAVVEAIYDAALDRELEFSKRGRRYYGYNELDINEDKEYEKGSSIFASEWGADSIEYEVGETVEVDDLCTSIFVKCGSGINFFLSKERLEKFVTSEMGTSKPITSTGKHNKWRTSRVSSSNLLNNKKYKVYSKKNYNW